MADGRVSYTDDNSLELILNAVIRQFETEVQRDQTLGDDEKRYCCTKFAQVRRALLLSKYVDRFESYSLKID